MRLARFDMSRRYWLELESLIRASVQQKIALIRARPARRRQLSPARTASIYIFRSLVDQRHTIKARNYNHASVNKRAFEKPILMTNKRCYASLVTRGAPRKRILS